MHNYFKVSFIFVLFYLPFLFLLLIPSNSIFLRPQDLHEDFCLKVPLPFICSAPSVTLAVIKPDGMSHENQIMVILEENGFKVIQDKSMQLGETEVSEWYFDKQDAPYYPSLVKYLTQRGPIRVLLLSRVQAIPALRRLIGPTNPDLARQSFPKSIRALYGTNVQENSIHASDSKESAEREFKLFFNKAASKQAVPVVTNTRHLE